MTDRPVTGFDLGAFLGESGRGRTIVSVSPDSFLFSQGTPADCIFYIHSGRVKLTVVSNGGKEATIMLLGPGDFVGEESLATLECVRAASATAITPCIALRIDREIMTRRMREESSLAELFVKCLLTRSMRVQADLVDHLLNGTEKRLARTLLLMAEHDNSGEPEAVIPAITQETLAEMVGTTRSRVNILMNQFRKRGCINYKRRIRVNKSLLSAVLLD